jgi:hypothetical protein
VAAVVAWVALGGAPGLALGVGAFALAVALAGVGLLAVLSLVMPSH